MLTAMDRNETTDYVVNREKKDDNPTVFKIGILDKKSMTKYIGKVLEKNEDINFEQLAELGPEIVKNGCKEVHNINYKGKVGNYPVDKELVEALPLDVIIEVASAVIQHNVLGKEESKN